MEVFDRRRLKLAELLKEISAADLSRRSGVSPSYISRCMKSPLDDGYKSIGEVTARKLELGAKKPEGWLDDNPVNTLAPLPQLGENFPPDSPNSASNMPLAQVGSAQAAINVVANEAQAVDIISAAMDMMTDAQRKEMSAKLAAWALAPDSAKLKKSVSESLTSATKSEPSKDD